MNHEPKLTVFIITLRPTPNCYQNSNKWLFRNLINQANTTRLEDSFIMGEVFTKFINALDTPAMFSDNITKRCMTANQQNISDPNVNANIFLHSLNSIIEGKVEGGTYGRKRNKTSTSNKTNRSNVDVNDAITEDFYFLLYSPLLSNKSVLMLQSYSDDSIDSVMKKFWQNFFSFPSAFYQPSIKRFVPQSIIDDFRNNATVSSLTFSTDIPGETLLESTMVQTERNYRVTVQVTPIEGDLTIAEFDETIEPLERTFFTRLMHLGQFSKKKGVLKDTTTNKTSPFELGSSFEIQPSILLSKYVEINGNESDFQRIKEYCFNLLGSINAEIYNLNAVQER